MFVTQSAAKRAEILMILTTLIVSACVIAFMLAVKLWEMKRGGAETFLTRFLGRGDKHVVAFFVRVRKITAHYREQAMFVFLVRLPAHVEAFSSEIKRRSHGKYHSLSVKMRGKRTLSSRGTVSPFMRTLASGTGRGEK